ncbi:MAG: peroxiredoxin [Flavobacteriales bacterium]|nr:peroxiredoxin [Flavobacteriales bacterium]
MKTGDLIPDLSLSNEQGELISLRKFIGLKSMVVYFYPKDDTTGCTREACAFRDHYEDFTEAGAEVIGISADDEKSHQHFAAKNKLPFNLLSDPDKKAQQAFGVKRGLLGLVSGRETFVFNREGKLIHQFSSLIRFEQHVKEALKAIKGE